MLKKLYERFGGILTGGVYGLLMRIFFGLDFRDLPVSIADLFSITFVGIVPVVIGLTPLIVSKKENLNNLIYRFFQPILSILTFLAFCFITKLEDIICLMIIALPFLLIAGFSGVLFGRLVLNYRKKNGILYSVFLLPIFTGFLETYVPTPTENVETTSSIIINANRTNIWSNIVRVVEIQETEYKKGFFNYAGIPRPLFAELDKDTLGGKRIGHFEGGLKFEENIIYYEKNRSISFDVRIIPSKIKQTIFERHILNGQHFKFLTATYCLDPLSDKQTAVSLTTKYQLDTKINFYGEFWARLLLIDFQDRLLKVIKTRSEK